MIAKGNPHNNGPYLARYLAADSKGNERAELAEIRGFATGNVFDAFALGQLQAEGTKCENPFFHVQVRLPKDEELTREQWQRVAERIERKLGFRDQPRAIVFHQKAGQEHMHLVWARLSVNDNRAINPGLFKRKLKEVCRAVEKEMGLKQVRNERDPEEKTQPAARGEFEESRRLKTDLKATRESIRECWDRSPDGASLSANLEKKGLVLAHGDRRDFVIIDAKGGMHALSKRITGATAPETRARLADIEAGSLPDIEQARAMQRERQPQGGQEAKALAQEMAVEDKDRATGKEEQEKLEAGREAEEARQKEIKDADEQRQQEIKDADERRQKEIVEADQKKQDAVKEETQTKDEEQRRAAFKEQADRQAEQARIMEQQQLRRDAYQAELQRQAEEGRKRERQTQADARASELEIRNPNYRYGEALAQHYNIKDPYGSLARSAMAEYGSFLRERQELDRQIARAKDPDERRALELRKGIESAEYMAITSDRIATQSEIIVGRKDTDEAVKQRERAVAFRKEAQGLRQEFRDIQAERAEGKSEQASPGKTPTQAKDIQPDAGRQPPPPPQGREEPRAAQPRQQQPEPLKAVAAKTPEVPPAPKNKPPEIRRDPAPEPKPAARGLMVEERPIGKPRGEAQSLDAFMQGASLPPQQPKQTFTPAQIRNDQAAKCAHYAQLGAQEKRGNALNRIGEDMRAGRNLSADDLRKLSRDDLEGIKANGGEHLKQLSREHEQQRARQQERER